MKAVAPTFRDCARVDVLLVCAVGSLVEGITQTRRLCLCCDGVLSMSVRGAQTPTSGPGDAALPVQPELIDFRAQASKPRAHRDLATLALGVAHYYRPPKGKPELVHFANYVQACELECVRSMEASARSARAQVVKLRRARGACVWPLVSFNVI